MIEEARVARNRDRLQECHPWLRTRLAQVIVQMQFRGYRPRIQEAWRSPEQQMTEFREGTSTLRWGFHCATNADGTPAALAADVLDDDRPLDASRAYYMTLARVAHTFDLSTGILFGLPVLARDALRKVITDPNRGWSEKSKIGWDPTHVEITGVSIAEARAGTRPTEPVVNA